MPLLAMLGVSLGVLRLIVATASWSLCVLVQISKPKISTERCLVSYIYMYIIYIYIYREREEQRKGKRDREREGDSTCEQKLVCSCGLG